MKRLLIMMGTGLCLQAFAGPVLINKCDNVRINSVPGGAGVYMSDDCKTAYVLPPLKGDLIIDNIVPNTNLRKCSILNSLIDTSNDLGKRIAAIAKRVREAEETSNGKGSDDNELFPGKPQQPIDNSADATKLKQAIEEVTGELDKLNSSLAVYEKLEGFSAQVLMIADQQALVEAYRKRNPNMKFEALTLREARLNFVRKDRTSQGQSNAVLLTEVAGIKALPGYIPVEGSDGLLWGGGLTANVVLSMTGACPFYDPISYRMLASKLSAKQFPGQVNASVTYVYDLGVNRQFKAQYHVANFVRRLQTSESHGGLFTSSTVNKLIVEKSSDDWFKWESKAQDDRNNWDETMRETVKGQIIDRVFKHITLLNGGAVEAAPGLSTPKANGAEVGAQNLRKCPYIYCQIGAAVLDVANALFGGSEAVSEYVNSQNYWAIETSDEVAAYPFLGSIAFGAK